MTQKNGYILVDFMFPNVNSKGHYSVGMMKWVDECPFSKSYCAFRFKAKRLAVKFIYGLLGERLYKLRKLVKG